MMRTAMRVLRATALFSAALLSTVSWGQATPLAAGAASAPAASTSAPAGRGARGGRGGGQALGTLPADVVGKDAFWGIWNTTDPKIVGTRLVQNFLSRRIMSGNLGVVYPESCMGYGSLRFLQSIGDKELADKVVARYGVILTPEGKTNIPAADHVDRSMFGIVPFEISRYLKSKPGDAALAKSYLDIGRNSADLQWAAPTGRAATADETALMNAGLTYQTRYWVDDMFMITSLQVQAFRATGDKVYLDRAAKEMASYLDKLQKPNGLFCHALDTPFYWGRGDGWFAVGMAELLSDLPADHPNRARIMDGYKKMMAGLLKNQGTDGMWHQLIDKPETWAETSSTGMFTFAFGVGVRKGWLAEPEYKTAAKKAWTSLCGYLDENANIREVCAGTNTAAATIPGGDEAAWLKYYIDRPRNVGDGHGQAAMIWAAWAMSADIK